MSPTLAPLRRENCVEGALGPYVRRHPDQDEHDLRGGAPQRPGALLPIANGRAEHYPTGDNVRVVDASSVLVGRASEEREIEGRLSLAEHGVGGLVVLVGEPGLGKTALAEHASVVARQRGFSVGWAACWQTAAVPPLQPWTELVGQLARPGVTSPELAILGGDRDSGRVEQAGRVMDWLRETYVLMEVTGPNLRDRGIEHSERKAGEPR